MSTVAATAGVTAAASVPAKSLLGPPINNSSNISSCIYSIIIILVLLIVISWVWYNYTGWQTFTFTSKPVTTAMMSPDLGISGLTSITAPACLPMVAPFEDPKKPTPSFPSTCNQWKGLPTTILPKGSTLVSPPPITIPDYAHNACADPNNPCPSWTVKNPAKQHASQLRFKKAVFTIKCTDGTVYTRDVTAVLNSMAVGIASTKNSGTNKKRPTLYLSDPLQPFSFAIVGVNDLKTLGDYPSPSISCDLTSKTAQCTENKAFSQCLSQGGGDYQCGAYQGATATSPGSTNLAKFVKQVTGATVTLTGQYRTL